MCNMKNTKKAPGISEFPNIKLINYLWQRTISAIIFQLIGDDLTRKNTSANYILIINKLKI